MTQKSVLRDDVLARMADLGTVDIVVGIPSFNNARTIGHVVRAIAGGLAKYFPDRRALLINSDGGSTDGTPAAVEAAELGEATSLLVTHRVERLQKVLTAYQGIPGKGSAFRTIFEIAAGLEAKACAVVDSDLRSITPEWVQLLIGPVLQHGYDFVCPLYSRHKYDGTITNSIVYPMVRALYGQRIRQPIGGDFGFSGQLADHFRAQDVWETEVARFGIDIWMTTTALNGGFRVCQSYLGAKIHDAKDPGSDLSAMLVQVAGSLFLQVEAHASNWMGVTESKYVPEFGFRYEVGLEPIAVNVQRMVDTFESGVRDFDGIYRQVLTEPTRLALQDSCGQESARFAIPSELWVHIVYEFAAAHHHRVLNPDHLLKSLTPLYLGRTASWVIQAASYGAVEVEAALDELCLKFEQNKSHLIELWKQRR